jgi:hypothetical protein
MTNHNNGNGAVATPLDSGTPSIVLPDGSPFSFKQIKDSGSALQDRDSLGSLPPGSVQPEPINFRAFPDGTFVELVKSQSSPGRLRFLIWNAGTVKFQEVFDHDGSRFVPTHIDGSLLEATSLPTGISPCGGDAAELLAEIGACISQYIELAPEYLRLVSHFVLYTWLQDLFPVAVYLWIIGPYSSGKTRLLTLLHALCRRAVIASDISPAALYSVPNAIMPTLLIDEFETSGRAADRDRLRLLRSGSTPDGHVIRGSKVYNTFGAKVVVSRREPSDAALASRAVFIPMLPTRKTLPYLPADPLQQISDRFQPQLLLYRLKNYSQLVVRKRPEIADFAPRVRDVALALAAPVLGNREVETQLFRDLGAQDNEAKLARHGEPEWAVITGLYLESHVKGGILTVGSLACTVRNVLLGNGETYELSPRAVGSILRSLGLTTQKLGNQGRGFRLTRQFTGQVHKLAFELGIRKSDILPYATVDAGYAGHRCYWCSKFGLLTRDDGKKLRIVVPRDVRRPRRGLYD